jgi:hypothetical protein
MIMGSVGKSPEVGVYEFCPTPRTHELEDSILLYFFSSKFNSTRICYYQTPNTCVSSLP